MFVSLGHAGTLKSNQLGKNVYIKKKIMMMQNDLSFPRDPEIPGICRWSQ